MFDKQYIVINVWFFDSQLPLIVNKFTVCINYVLIFWWTDEHMFLPIWIDKIGKNQDKSLNEMSVSSISTDWPIQSISINQIYRLLWIYQSIPIFTDWLRGSFSLPSSLSSLPSSSISQWQLSLFRCGVIVWVGKQCNYNYTYGKLQVNLTFSSFALQENQ